MAKQTKRKANKCSVCGKVGHNRLGCFTLRPDEIIKPSDIKIIDTKYEGYEELSVKLEDQSLYFLFNRYEKLKKELAEIKRIITEKL